MREAPIILPVFTTSVPLDFPPEGTFAFNKKTHKQVGGDGENQRTPILQHEPSEP